MARSFPVKIQRDGRYFETNLELCYRCRHRWPEYVAP